MNNFKFETFDINNDDWESYKERFVFFFTAHGVIDTVKKKAIFFASCGSDLYNLVKSLVFPQTVGQATLTDIESKLNEHFSPRPNEIVESFKFHNRKQGTGGWQDQSFY